MTANSVGDAFVPRVVPDSERGQNDARLVEDGNRPVGAQILLLDDPLEDLERRIERQIVDHVLVWKTGTVTVPIELFDTDPTEHR